MQSSKIYFVLTLFGIHLLIGLLSYLWANVEPESGGIAPYQGKIVFLVSGSHPAGIPIFTSPVIKNERYGVSGSSINELSKNLQNLPDLSRVRAMVILTGQNDSSDDELILFINQLPDSVPLLWFAVPPVDNRIETQTNNAKINGFNQRIKKICASKENCSFVDLTPQLSDTNGNLKSDYHSGDGVNFNSKSSQIWVNTVKSLVP